MKNKSSKTNRRSRKGHRKYVKRNYKTRNLRGGRIENAPTNRDQPRRLKTLHPKSRRPLISKNPQLHQTSQLSASATTYLRNLNAIAGTIDKNDDLAGDLLIPFVDNYEDISKIKTGGMHKTKKLPPAAPSADGLFLPTFGQKQPTIQELELKEQAGLPENWSVHFSTKDNAFMYVNHVANILTFIRPSPVAAAPVAAPVAAYGSSPMLPAPWIQQFDPASGNLFYVNTVTKESTWTPPPPPPPPPPPSYYPPPPYPPPPPFHSHSPPPPPFHLPSPPPPPFHLPSPPPLPFHLPPPPPPFHLPPPPPPFHSPSPPPPPPPPAEPDIFDETKNPDFGTAAELDSFVRKYANLTVGEHAPCWWHKIDAYERAQLTRLCKVIPPPPECLGNITFGNTTLVVDSYDGIDASMDAFSEALNKFIVLTKSPMQRATGQELTAIMRPMLHRKTHGCSRARIPHLLKAAPLTFCEIAAIYFFTQPQEQSGTFSTYTMLRSSMQFGNVKSMKGRQYADMIREKLVTFFFSAVSKCPRVKDIRLRSPQSVGGYLHRLMPVPETVFNLYKDGMNVGDKVTFYCFQSFSLNLSAGNIMQFSSYSVEKPCLLILRIRVDENTTARYISHLSAIEEEEEVLALPCIPYNVAERREHPGYAAGRDEVVRTCGIPGDVTPWQLFKGFIVITLSQLEYEVSMRPGVKKPFNG